MADVPFLWVPELSPASATAFNSSSSQQLNPSTSLIDCNKVKATLRLTVSQSVSQSVSLGVMGLMTRYLLLFDSYGLVFVGRLL
jgi:hypothetical protein